MSADTPLDAEQVRALRVAGRHDEHLPAALELVAARPSDFAAQREAAFACDFAGDEHQAVRHYDAAWQLGCPPSERRRLLTGYASTLRNVGRVDEAIALLSEAQASDPGYLPHLVFLSLALHSGGHQAAALATMLGGLLDLAERCAAADPSAPHPLDRYQRAITAYWRELLDQGTR
ncbi:MAG: tetratricopeptide repeat protein [Kofleriaceae bacterium]